MLSSRLSVGALMVAVCVGIIGCGRSAIGLGEREQLEDGVQPGDGDGDGDSLAPIDAGEQPSMDSGLPPPIDAGGMDDGGSDAAMDAGPDGAIDAGDGAIDDGGLDAGDAGNDAGVLDPDPLTCFAITDAPREQLGTPSDPFEVALGDLPLAGEVDERGRAFIRLTGLTAGEAYGIAVEGSPIALSVFDEQDVFGAHACSRTTAIAGRAIVCEVTAGGSTLDITLNGYPGVQPFELKVVPVVLPEGTKEMPVPLALSDLPQELRTGLSQPSFYEITGLDPAITYAFKGTAGTGMLGFAIFPQGYQRPPELQRSPSSGAIGQASDGSMLLAAIGSTGDTPITLEVIPVSGESEGSADAPVILGASDLPYEGQLGWAFNNDVYAPAGHQLAASYYAITDLEPGNYLISLEGRPGLQLSVDDQPITDVMAPRCSVQSTQTSTLDCGIRATGSTLYVKVVSPGGDGTSFTLAMSPSPYEPEGTKLEPRALALTSLPYSGEALGTGFSYYRITGLTPDQPYVVRASDQSGIGTSLLVIDESASTTWCEYAMPEGPIQCKATPTGTSLLVRVSLGFEIEGSAPGGTFTLDLAELDERPTSNFMYPIDLECSEGRVEATLGESGVDVYRVRGLTPGERYIVEARSDFGVEMSVYQDHPTGGVSVADCTAFGDAQNVASCFIEAHDAGGLLVQVTGPLLGGPIELEVRHPKDGSEGTADAPIVVPAGQLPHFGRVASADASYYVVTGLAPAQRYMLHFGTAEEHVQVQPYLDRAMTDPLSAFVVSPGAPAELEVQPSRSTMVFVVTMIEPADWVTDVSIDLMPL